MHLDFLVVAIIACYGSTVLDGVVNYPKMTTLEEHTKADFSCNYCTKSSIHILSVGFKIFKIGDNAVIICNVMT